MAFRHDNTFVTLEKLLEALDFLVSLEPDPYTEEAEDGYNEMIDSNSESIRHAESVVRRFAKQVRPQTLKSLQEQFNSIIETPKYHSSEVAYCVVAATINKCWNEIAGWQS